MLTSMKSRRHGVAIVGASLLAVLSMSGCTSGGAGNNSAAQKVVDNCKTEGLDLSANGEVLVIRSPLNDTSNGEPSPFESETWKDGCVAEQGFLDGQDIESAFSTMDEAMGSSTASEAMISEAGLVVIADDAFVRMTMWDGDKQMTDLAKFVAEKMTPAQDEDFDIPNRWAFQVEIGPEAGQYPATDLAS